MKGGNQSQQMATRTNFSNCPRVSEYHEAQELLTPPSKNLGLSAVGCKYLLIRNKPKQSAISKHLHGHTEQGIVLSKQLCRQPRIPIYPMISLLVFPKSSAFNRMDI